MTAKSTACRDDLSVWILTAERHCFRGRMNSTTGMLTHNSCHDNTVLHATNKWDGFILIEYRINSVLLNCTVTAKYRESSPWGLFKSTRKFLLTMFPLAFRVFDPPPFWIPFHRTLHTLTSVQSEHPILPPRIAQLPQQWSTIMAPSPFELVIVKCFVFLFSLPLTPLPSQLPSLLLLKWKIDSEVTHKELLNAVCLHKQTHC